jgi:hypothetical protein
MLFNVPGAKSSPGCPAMVTRPMAAPCRYKIPAVGLDHLDDITDFHRWSILSGIGELKEHQPALAISCLK